MTIGEFNLFLRSVRWLWFRYNGIRFEFSFL